MQNELVYHLPDSYAKPVRGREEETATNTWKLFQLSEAQSDDFYEKISILYDMLDISNCSGDALARLGEMYGCSRGTQSDDAVYRAEVLSKIVGYFSDSSANTILRSISIACGLKIGDIYLKETTPAMVHLYMSSVSALEKLPFSLHELYTVICNLLAVGVGLEKVGNANGTFRYCGVGEESDSVYDGTGYGEGTFGKTFNLEETA